MVHFVGAGSGAVDLITVRGARLLKEADVVIYAGSLVNPEVLSYTSEGCEIYNSAEMTLEQVLDVVKAAEQAGKTTVRLHTGDSSIYGAVREQFDELIQLGYERIRVEGLREGRWVVADYGDILVHIFHKDEREFYDIERLWKNGDNYLEYEG